jgi:membrane protein implicated in regulation of membrane protease activity
MDVSALLDWWNFIFLLPLLAGLVLALGIALSGLDAGEHGGAEGGGDDGGDGGEANLLLQFLSLFGLGQGVPLSVMLPILLAVWGVSGLILNGLLSPLLPPTVFAPISIAAGLVLAMLVGRLIATALRRVFADKETAIRSGGLVGCVGRAVFAITAERGLANIKDPFGNVHRAVCRVYEGQPDIAAGEEILVIEFIPEERVYYVKPYGML